MDTDDDLGPPVIWNIKGIPATIRERVTRAAAEKGVTVASWLAAYIVHHGIEGEAIPIRISELSGPPPGSRSGTSSIEEACRLAETVAKLAEASGDKKPRAVIQAAARMLRQHVEARTTPDAPSTRKALTQPSARTALPAPDGEATEESHA